MTLIEWLFGTEPHARAARRKAIAYAKAIHPGTRGHRATLRAAEPMRFVFDVFFWDPANPRKPMPYRLIAVSRTSEDISKIHPSHDSLYRIRNYR